MLKNYFIMIKVKVMQHLIHSEKEFVKELSKSTFKVPKNYSFDNLYDEDDALDGATLIFDLDKKDIN